MIASKGFDNVLNMAGGIRAWDNPVALGSEEQGLSLFDGSESPENTLKIAYSLEAGLSDFYLSMIEKVNNKTVQALFQKLSQIEVKHQDRIFDEYLLVSAEQIDRALFDAQFQSQALEGGLTTDEYLALFKPDLESTADIVSLAMSIEAQALDLYTRASETRADERSLKVLKKIAREERTHLEQLGRLFEEL